MKSWNESFFLSPACGRDHFMYMKTRREIHDVQKLGKGKTKRALFMNGS